MLRPTQGGAAASLSILFLFNLFLAAALPPALQLKTRYHRTEYKLLVCLHQLSSCHFSGQLLEDDSTRWSRTQSEGNFRGGSCQGIYWYHYDPLHNLTTAISSSDLRLKYFYLPNSSIQPDGPRYVHTRENSWSSFYQSFSYFLILLTIFCILSTAQMKIAGLWLAMTQTVHFISFHLRFSNSRLFLSFLSPTYSHFDGYWSYLL